MSVPVKSALKSPLSRFSTSNGWSVTSSTPPAATPEGNGPPGMMRARVCTWTCVSGLVPTMATNARRSIPKSWDETGLVAMVCGQDAMT
jgi:hypothetical protein